jgi:hypothetical protein
VARRCCSHLSDWLGGTYRAEWATRFVFRFLHESAFYLLLELLMRDASRVFNASSRLPISLFE